MNLRSWMLLLMLCSGAALTGCTSREWYEALQEQQRQNCYKLENRDEIQRCLDRVGNVSYEEYQSARKGSE